MGPLIPQEIIDPQWNSVIALLIGMAFGFILESSGFSSSRKLAGVFYGYDFVVLKVFFTAAITAALGLYYFDYAGWIDGDLLYINPTYLTGAIAGGVVMGIGFVLGGFCPGTSTCAAAIGKIDGWVFWGGMLVGVFIFSEFFPLLQEAYTSNALGPIRVYESLGLNASTFIMILIVVALAAFYVASMIQKKIRPKRVEF
ncbi:MAG: YeeE/YedE family protein [Bacteroidales bacterium]|nr:YeeE/YedE family protein [Bacteroidales bacterium]MCF8333144.1 YeeE/YedE family protein [Bacteroidales bacterium]